MRLNLTLLRRGDNTKGFGFRRLEGFGVWNFLGEPCQDTVVARDLGVCLLVLAWSGVVLGDVGGVRAGSKANISATLVERARNQYHTCGSVQVRMQRFGLNRIRV